MKKKNNKLIIGILLFLAIVLYAYTIHTKDPEAFEDEIDLVYVDTNEEDSTIYTYEPITSEIVEENPVLVKEETKPIKKEVIYTCPKPNKEYEDMKFAYVGQDKGLPDITYIPKNLEPLGSELATIPSICMESEALEALRAMLKDAQKVNIIMKAVSGFRSYEKQNSILESRMSWGPEDAHKFVAKPGHSEHQLGTAVDISGQSIGYSAANGNFHGTPEELWLRENAHKYGFVMSYPYEKEEITGYGYEPWHWRYLGLKNATYIYENDFTITEFLK